LGCGEHKLRHPPLQILHFHRCAHRFRIKCIGRRAKGEGSVYQRKDGSWVAQLNGTYRYARTEEAAKAKLYKLLAGAEEFKPQNISVEKHLRDYLKHAQANLKPRTVKRYREAIDAHLRSAFSKEKLHTLDAQKIERVYAKKLEQGLSPASIHVLHAVLSASLKRAVRLKLIQHNPCKDVQKPKVEREEVGKRSRRTITLPKIAHDALRRRIAEGDYANSDYLFPNGAGKPMWRTTFINNHWKPLLKRAGVEFNYKHYDSQGV
jgi:integrase-like protein